MLSEISQSGEDKYWRIPLTGSARSSQIHRGGKENTDYGGLGGGVGGEEGEGSGELLFNENRALVL